MSLSGADEVDEGDSETYTYTVSDPGVDDTFSVDLGFPDCDFGATNNGVLVGTPVQTAAGGSFVCKFPDGDKSATVKIKVTDNDGGSSTDSADVVVVDIANVVPSVTPPADQTAVEGSSKSFNLGSFTDPGPDNPWTVDIDWGDMSPHTTFTMTNTGSLGSQSHTYPNGPVLKTVTAKVTDKNEAIGTTTFKVDVLQRQPDREQPTVRVRPGARHGDGELQLRGWQAGRTPTRTASSAGASTPRASSRPPRSPAPRRSSPTPRGSRRTRVRSRPAATASLSPARRRTATAASPLR